MNQDPLLTEYYEIFQTVNEFDKRLLTVKSWGVTLSLAALAWGFQDQHYGLFLVAALSGAGFWLIEGVMKRHQMCYYFRMREIEVLQYRLLDGEEKRARSTPRIDSSWNHAKQVYSGQASFDYQPVPQGPQKWYRQAWFLPHVFLPHIVSVVAGLVLLLLAMFEVLGDMVW